MTTSQQKLLPWLSNLVTKTIDQGLPVLPEVLFLFAESNLENLFSSVRVRSDRIIFHSQFCLLCCSLLCSALLFSSVLCSSLLCGFSGREMPFSGREKTMGMGISPVDAQQGCILLCSMEQLHRLRSPPLWFSRPLMCRCIRLDWHSFYPHLYAGLYKKLTTNGQLGENIFRSVQSIP